MVSVKYLLIWHYYSEVLSNLTIFDEIPFRTDFSGRYSLQEAGTSSENTAIGVSSTTEDTCKTTCAADVRCLVAVYQSTNETCSLYNMAAVSMTSSLQPNPGVVLLQWEPLSSGWTYLFWDHEILKGLFGSEMEIVYGIIRFMYKCIS